MGKISRSIYIDEDVAEQVCNTTGMNLSEICSVALQSFLQHEIDDVTLFIKLEVIKRERHILTVEKAEIEQRLKELDDLEEKVTTTHDATVKRTAELSVSRKLNDALIRNNFDADEIVINHKDLIDQMIEIHGDSWSLPKYIDRYRKVLAQ